MSPEGNRYSMDGSVDLPKDLDLPVDSELLWPLGSLLQLQWLVYGERKGDPQLTTRRYIMYLHPRELVIAVETEPEKNVPWEPNGLGDLYRFYTGGTSDERAYSVQSIAKVELNRSWSPRFAIWTTGDDHKLRKVFVAYGIGTPNTFVELADRSVLNGIGRPRPDGLFGTRGMHEYSQQLLHREIERQFRRAAPQAEIVLKGDHMPVEDFRRVIR